MSPVVTEGRVYQIVNEIVTPKLDIMAEDIKQMNATLNKQAGGISVGKWGIPLIISVGLLIAALLSVIIAMHNPKAADILFSSDPPTVAQTTQDASR